jgi:hypothetical protein
VSDVHEKYGSRFTPPELLVEMAERGESFYGALRAGPEGGVKL